MRRDQGIPHVKRAVASHEAGKVFEDLDSRLRKFGTHDARNRSADDTSKDREDKVERADVLVVGRHEPTGKECGLVVCAMMTMGVNAFEGVGGGDSFSHRSDPQFLAAAGTAAGAVDCAAASAGGLPGIFPPLA